MNSEELSSACSHTSELIKQALNWVQNEKNNSVVSHKRPLLERMLRRQDYTAQRLLQSVNRPMCVGVFGPSQVGKSYLVSVLARKGTTLTALFNDPARPEVDFITEINPYGEKEATGLVTRFTIHPQTTPADYPVFLRLLTQSDLVKILANAYFLDGDHQEELQISPENIEAHVSKFEALKKASYCDVLREEEIWDIEEYFERHLKRAETRVFSNFWNKIAHIAPYLGLVDRAEFFSILWGRHQQLTALYRSLSESLFLLGFPDEAYCRLEALIPAASSILNVDTLTGLGETSDSFVTLRSQNGATTSLPRAVVAALAAELCITLKENPWPFFNHTDLLDFPGYRSRTKYNLNKFLLEGKGNALKELFLRGKVDYLFQRYTAQQELTSMLLCLKPSNLDVATLPAVIEDWITATHGADAEARRGKPTLLFFCLTMFDTHLSEKVGDEQADPGLRFEARMKASLIDPFAKLSDSWVLNWTPGEAFKNCFWVRNPNYKAEGIIEYDGRQELKIHEHKKARIAEIRRSYSQVAEVQRHFRDPLRAFDEVMKLNDGGISYIAEELALVCRPGMKQAQILSRIKVLRQNLNVLLKPHYVPSDLGKRLEERNAVFDKIVEDFEVCMTRNVFGSFLNKLCVDRSVLADALHEPSLSQPKSIMVKQSLSDMIKGAPALLSQPQRSRYDYIVQVSMQIWVKYLHDLCDNEVFSEQSGLSRQSLREIAQELTTTSRRLKLDQQIANVLDQVGHIERSDQLWAKATIVSQKIINHFVSNLSIEGSRPEAKFDPSGLANLDGDFHRDYALNWMRAFYEHLKENASSSDGLIHDAEQNMALGRILDGFSSSIETES